MEGNLPFKKIGGIEIGRRGDPYNPTLKQFRDRGVPVARDTVHHWRAGIRQGGATRRRLEVPEIISKEGSARKNAQLLRIIETAFGEREMRVKNSAVVPNRRYGLTSSVAEALGVPQGEIGMVFRLMRADVCLAEKIPESVIDSFVQAVDEFRSQHPLRSSRESPLTRKLHEKKWQGNLKEFYGILDEVGAPTVKAWIPHELEMFNTWYLYQQESNNLTAFDRIVLENWSKYNLQFCSKEIRSLTGVPLDKHVLATHVRLLEDTFLPKVG